MSRTFRLLEYKKKEDRYEKVMSLCAELSTDANALLHHIPDEIRYKLNRLSEVTLPEASEMHHFELHPRDERAKRHLPCAQPGSNTGDSPCPLSSLLSVFLRDLERPVVAGSSATFSRPSVSGARLCPVRLALYSSWEFKQGLRVVWPSVALSR